MYHRHISIIRTSQKTGWSFACWIESNSWLVGVGCHDFVDPRVQEALSGRIRGSLKPKRGKSQPDNADRLPHNTTQTIRRRIGNGEEAGSRLEIAAPGNCCPAPDCDFTPPRGSAKHRFNEITWNVAVVVFLCEIMQCEVEWLSWFALLTLHSLRRY